MSKKKFFLGGLAGPTKYAWPMLICQVIIDSDKLLVSTLTSSFTLRH